MKKIFTFIFLTFFISLKAQENLLSMLESNDDVQYASYLFKGTKVINGQSVELPSRGVLQFTIQHRFGKLNDGLYNLYGLDNSQIRLSFDYGVRDWLSICVGRSSNLKTIDLNSKIRLQRQVQDGFPVTIVFNSAIYIKQWLDDDFQDQDFVLNNQLSYVNQVLIAKKINRNLTLQLTPTIVHYNLIEVPLNSSNDIYALGISGRQKFSKRVSINFEHFYQINDKINKNVFSLGFDIETGGHVFQLHFSNSFSMIDSHFITKTTDDWLNGDIYFGFNISRVFNIR